MLRPLLTSLVVLASLLVAPALPAQADDVAVATTTTLTATSPSTRRVDLLVDVTAEDGSVPTGSVEVHEGEQVVATLALTDGRGSTTVEAAPGQHTYVATYLPDDPAFQGSSSAPATVTAAGDPVVVCRASSCQWTSLSIRGPGLVTQGRRPVVRVKVWSRSDVATGRVRLVLRGPGTRWRVARDLTDSRLRVRLPRLRRPGPYRLAVTFRPASRSGAEAASETEKFMVERRRD